MTNLADRIAALTGAEDSATLRAIEADVAALLGWTGEAFRHVKPPAFTASLDATRREIVTRSWVGSGRSPGSSSNTSAGGSTSSATSVPAMRSRMAATGVAIDRRIALLVEREREVVFDATARHRTDHHAVAADRRQRADRTRRGTPGPDDGGEHHAMAAGDPVAGGADHL